jgi:DNA polymerase elongation subunit (family B)
MERILEYYKRDQIELLKLRFPEKTEEELSKFLDEEIKSNLKNTDCKLVNNYTKKTAKLNLLRFTEWYFDKKPISTEHGVFFKRHEQAINLPARMLEHILNSRKANKKKMFQAEEAGDRELAKYYNTRQKVDKIFANSYYGVSGQSSSVFYNLFVALSITGKGQSIISTAMTTFERFLANNILFRNLDECLLFINTVISEPKEILDSEVLDKDIPKETVFKYLLKQFYGISPKMAKEKYGDIIQSTLDNIDQVSLNRIYYKNNIYAFLKNKKMFAIIEEILKAESDFKNPEKLPTDCSDQIQELWRNVKEFVFYNHPVFNRIHVLKTIKRKAVIVVNISPSW